MYWKDNMYVCIGKICIIMAYHVYHVCVYKIYNVSQHKVCDICMSVWFFCFLFFVLYVYMHVYMYVCYIWKTTYI